MDPHHGSAGGAGRFAPSPSGDLHLGNLRTALLAWLFARSTGRRFLIRVEDLDRVRPGAEARQLADLAALGLDADPPVVRQSDRLPGYRTALDRLRDAGLVYGCFCTRREIREAASAPQVTAAGAPSVGTEPGLARPSLDRLLPAAEMAYPGTCRALTSEQIAAHRASGRVAAWRLRAGDGREPLRWTVTDDLLGEFTGLVDDVVLQRNDGVPAYNLAVVVDDADQGIDQVVRGDDLLTSAPRQAHLAHLLGLPPVRYAHVPLALTPDGARLAKRDGAVTLADLVPAGWTPPAVLTLLAASLGLAEPGEPVTPAGLLTRFDPSRLPHGPWRIDPATLSDPAAPHRIRS
ncbi:tRNA glutamyl-Q(34) synthetase GluQRS [Nakamurella sp. YIM 132084]|uniref:Glutamyl-Q tRNA(Asp) synthetase n=1 Tax=Nakamurella leprariae TaxID=2803911 RepID=A0A939BZD3_9ACTN|nr:tRNA glutamyl-Q(34) synthetase GluQRS [Nakamurella leprariae]